LHGRGVTGTVDREKDEITLDMNPAETSRIFLGGLLVGKGYIPEKKEDRIEKFHVHL
jgi:hypothetical protein